MMQPMTTVITHISALQLYRTGLFDNPEAGMRQPARQPEIARAIAHAKPSRNEAEALLADMPQDAEKPVHLLVADERARCRSNLVRCHVSPPVLPRRALTRIDGDRYVASPHFLFQQMAPSLSLVELVCLGFELCGDYRLSNGAERGFRQRDSFGTPTSFQQLADCGPWTKGGKKAQLALRFVCGHSASPMETIAAIPLTLPCACGGYGLPKPQMNCRINLSKNGRATSGKSYVVADICWPEHKICAEYQSTQFHTGAERINADAHRQTALEERGYSVFEITAQQALSEHGMDGIARAIAKKMGRKFRPQASWAHKQQAMRKDLLTWHGFDV